VAAAAWSASSATIVSGGAAPAAGTRCSRGLHCRFLRPFLTGPWAEMSCGDSAEPDRLRAVRRFRVGAPAVGGVSSRRPSQNSLPTREALLEFSN